MPYIFQESNNPIIRFQSAFVLILTFCLFSASAAEDKGGSIVATLKEGDWTDSSVWSSSPPDITEGDRASIGHSPILIPRNESVGARRIDLGNFVGDGGIVLDCFSTLTVTEDIIVGNNGNSGQIISREGSSISVEDISIGFFAPGNVKSGGAVFQTTQAAGSGGASIDIGTNGFDGSLIKDGSGSMLASDGLRLGSNGTLAFQNNTPSIVQIQVIGSPLVFENGSVIDLSAFNVPTDIEIGDTLPLVTYDAGITTPLPTLIPPTGYLAELDDKTPGEVGVKINDLPFINDLLSTGTVNWFDGTAWNSVDEPTTGGFTFITNNASVFTDRLTSSTPGLNKININSLAIGDASGSGTLTWAEIPLNILGVSFLSDLSVGNISAADEITTQVVKGIVGEFSYTEATSLIIADDFVVGNSTSTGSSEVEISGSASVEQVELVEIRNDLVVGESNIAQIVIPMGAFPNGASSIVSGDLVLRDINELNVEGDFDVSNGGILNVLSTPSLSIQNSNVLLENINEVRIGGDMNLGENQALTSETENIEIQMVIKDISKFDIKGDLDSVMFVSEGTATGPSIGRLDVELNLENTNLFCNGFDWSSTTRVGDESIVEISTRMNLLNSTFTVGDGDNADIGTGLLVGASGPMPMTNHIDSFVTLSGSQFTALDRLQVGRLLNTVPVPFDARLELSNGSITTASRLVVGQAGTIVLQLAGLDQVSEGTIGNTNSYSYIDVPHDVVLGANAVDFDGTLIADFDFTLPGGEHSFDLIESTGPVVIPGTLQTQDLDPSFNIKFFDVVNEGGKNILRLTVSDIVESVEDWNTLDD